MCQGETQEMTKIKECYYGKVTTQHLARMLYASHMRLSTLPGEEDMRACKSIVNHLEDEHRLPPETMAKEQMRSVKLWRKMCRDSQGKLNAELYLHYCKERDVALPLALCHIPKFNLEKFKRVDAELWKCFGEWLSENQIKLHELRTVIFSSPDGTYDATTMHQYKRLSQLMRQMYTVPLLKIPPVDLTGSGTG